MLEKVGYLPKAEPETSSDSTLTTSRKNRRNNKNKRRFSDAQIKSMETMFETESKLEPKAKIQLAKELDLQPRQVAIWFQNRRARWKSKQLERDYNLLKANYDALATKFEAINKEKQMLLMQLQKMNEQRRKPTEETAFSADGNSTDGDSDNGVNNKYETEQKPGVSFEESDFRMANCSDDDNHHHMYFGEAEDVDLMSVMDPANPILTPTFDSNNSVFDNQSCGTSQWWDFWS